MLFYEAIETLAKIRRPTSNIKTQGVSEVVSETFAGQNPLLRMIPKDPAVDTLTYIILLQAVYQQRTLTKPSTKHNCC